jgi:hypothetical protein
MTTKRKTKTRNIADLQKIVDEGFDASASGRIAGVIGDAELVAQKHLDGRKFTFDWSRRWSGVEYWRLIIFVGDFDLKSPKQAACDALAQLDIHDDGAVRVQLFEQCSVTVDPRDKLFVLTRYWTADQAPQ